MTFTRMPAPNASIPQGKARAVAPPGRRARHWSHASANRVALVGVGAVVKPRAWNGGRRVRSVLGNLAHTETTLAHAVPDAGLGQVHPNGTEFEALAELRCHTLPSVAPKPPAG